MKTLFFILLLSTTAFPCGVTQHLYGLIHDDGYPISNAIVKVSIGGNTLTEIQTGPFGLYSTMVGPCPEQHLLSVSHRRYTFQSVGFWSDGSGNSININVEGLRMEGRWVGLTWRLND